MEHIQDGAHSLPGSAPETNIHSSKPYEITANKADRQPKAASEGNFYPLTPGFKGNAETGRDGARMFASKCGSRQAEALEALRELGEASAEQIAEHTSRHWYLVRPRLSELKAQGKVQDTGRRAATGMGGQTTVWRLSTPEELALHHAREAVEAEKYGEAANG